MKIEVHVHHHYPTDRALVAWLKQFEKRITNSMSALSDAVAAVVEDVTRIGDDVTKVLDILQQPNPDVAAAITALQAVDEGLDATAERLEAVLPPA